VELVKFLEKTQIVHIQIIVDTLKMTSCRSYRTMSKNKIEKK
jgi:hypothetical protein